jgi:C-terminal processing protease CtpA/Prc
MPTTPPDGRRGPALALAAAMAASGIADPLAVAATAGPTPAAASAATGVETIVGAVTVTSPLVGRAFTEPFVTLSDLAPFAARDLLAPPPSPVQILANLEGSLRDGAGFTMPLPIRPEGSFLRFGDGPGPGVQVYAVDFQVNIAGDPFLDPVEAHGWPTALASVAVEQGTNEVTGGKVVVWAPDGGQVFPTGFGADGKLFTADDPLGPIAAGWTVVDLDARPFRHLRQPRQEVAVIEGSIGLRDLSDRTYTHAFDELLAELRRRYPFAALKGTDWDALAAAYRPQVAAAEAAGDLAAFNVAMMRLAVAMNDGHVGVDLPQAWVTERYGGGFGLGLGKADDGAVVVRCVTRRSPAADAAIQPGSAIVSWGGQAPAAALAALEPYASRSTAAARASLRLRLLARAPIGGRVEVAWRTSAGEERAATLTAVADPDGLSLPCGAPHDPAELPVTARVLPSGLGYVRVNSFSEDITLTTHAWEWALRRLREEEVPALVVDIRDNGGGLTRLPIYLAGSFADEPYVFARQIFTDDRGRRVTMGIDRVEPTPVRWNRPVAVLVNERCVSACELFAAALARDDRTLVVGMEGTAGVVGGIYPWKLPGGLPFRAPLVAFEDPAGNVLLEGRGVQPTVRVPRTAETLLLGPGAADAVLAAAEAALLEDPKVRRQTRERRRRRPGLVPAAKGGAGRGP